MIDVKDFVKTFGYDMTPIQKEFIQTCVTKDGALLDLGSSRRQEDKQFIAALNIFALLNRLELDESFGFIIPDGIKIFKLVKVMPHDIKCQNTKVVNDGIQ